MNRYVLILLALTGIILLKSCVKVLDYDIPEDEKKIVVNGIISDYKPVTIHVNKSLHVLDRLIIKPLDNATVRLYENDVLISEIMEGKNGAYFSDFTGICGNIYRLEVLVPGMKTASATCILPYPVMIEKVDTILVTNESNYYDYLYKSFELRSTIAFSDPEKTENYYELEGTLNYREAIYFYDIDTSYITGYRHVTRNSIIISTDPVFEFAVAGNQVYSNQSENNFIIGEKLMFSDRLINGLKYNLNVSFNSDLFDINNETSDSVSLDVCLKSVTKDYYTYMQLLERHMQARHDPFSERAQVNTNIENGLGILAGTAESVYRIEFNKTQNPK